MSDIATKQFDLKREYLRQISRYRQLPIWRSFDTWLVVRIIELEAEKADYSRVNKDMCAENVRLKSDVGELEAKLLTNERASYDLGFKAGQATGEQERTELRMEIQQLDADLDNAHMEACRHE